MFNPPIFQPQWFASWGLIRQQEAEAASIEIIHPDAAVFSADWLQVHVTRDRFYVGTMQDPSIDPLRDLVSSIFELLSHTPVGVMGLNADFHYRLPSARVMDTIGQQLAPRVLWDRVLQTPTMASLTMKEFRQGSYPGWLGIVVEPSNKVQPGVYIGVNDHYQLTEKTEPITGTKVLQEILAEKWSDSLGRSKNIALSIAELGGRE